MRNLDVGLLIRQLTVLSIVIFMTACVPGNDLEDADCPCLEGWKCCNGKCIPEENDCSDLDNNTDSDSNTNAEMDPGISTATATDNDTSMEATVGTDTHTDTLDDDTDSHPVLDAGTDTESDTGTESESDTGTESESATETDTDTGTESETDTNLVKTDDQWSISTVDIFEDIGGESSIALDKSGKVHITYYDYKYAAIKYVSNAQGSWNSETVDSGGSAWYDATSIAIDQDGKAHLAYCYYYGNCILKYATNKSGEWVQYTLEPEPDKGRYARIALDGNGSAHIVYWDDNTYDLKYATNKTGEWKIAILDSCNNSGPTGIAADADGNIHIVYGIYDSPNLKYATNKGGDWEIATVDTYGKQSQSASIAVDASGHVHISSIACLDDTNWELELRYVTNASGKWIATTLDPGYSVGFDAAIAVDRNEKVHIAYSYDTPSYNSYAAYANNTGGEWVFTIIDVESLLADNLPIALDQNDKVHMSYSTQNNGTMNNAFKYATNSASVHK